MMVNGTEVCPQDCQERDPYCHSNCERYLNFYQSRINESKKRLLKGKAYMFTVDSIRRTRSGDCLSVKKYRPKGGHGDERETMARTGEVDRQGD